MAAAGKIDCLINNAVSVEPGDIHTGTFDAFAKTQVLHMESKNQHRFY